MKDAFVVVVDLTASQGVAMTCLEVVPYVCPEAVPYDCLEVVPSILEVVPSVYPEVPYVCWALGLTVCLGVGPSAALEMGVVVPSC